MKSVRRGNDISVTWSLFQDGNPFFAEGQDITLYLDSAFKKEKITAFTVNGNVISWIFWGKDQKTTGRYSLRLVLNEGETCMATVDQCDFVKIVSSSCMTGGDNPEDVITEYVSLSSNIGFVTGGSYDDAELREMIEGKVDKVDGKQLSTEDFTSKLKEKLDGLSNYDDAELREMIEGKVDKVDGKQLSTEDFTSKLKEKLDGLSNYDDTKLVSDLNVLKGNVDNKQDRIEDLERIREGAQLGSTALQSHQDISHLATKAEANAANEKQDEDIAALGEARKNLSIQIAENKSRIDATATNVIKLTEELDVLNGEGDGSIEDIVSKEIAKVIASAPEDLDTLREIADFIEAEATEASHIVTKLDDHAERIKKLEDKNLDIVMMTESQYEMLPEKENKLYFLYED